MTTTRWRVSVSPRLRSSWRVSAGSCSPAQTTAARTRADQPMNDPQGVNFMSGLPAAV
jgi:hypothetical protein